MDKAYGRVKAKQAIAAQLWQNRMMNAQNGWQRHSAQICGGARQATAK
jgi:hypothetical protein